MSDHTTADILYPTSAQHTSTVPPVEATAPIATKPATQPAGDATPNPIEQHTDDPYGLTLPENALLEPRAIERTSAFAKTADLSPELAQQALNHANAEVVAYRENLEAKSLKVRTEDWPAATRADPDLGGAHFAQTMAEVDQGRRAARDAGVWDQGLVDYLEQSGLGNHPAAVKLIAWVGRLVTGGVRGSGADGRTAKTDAEVLYGNTRR